MNRFVIMRGVPGSGKSSIAKLIFDLEPSEKKIICSNDNYPGYYEEMDGTPTSKYTWTPQRAKKAVEYCRSIFLNAINNDFQLIILDNTNLNRRPYSWYESKARQNGYAVEKVSIKGTVALVDVYAQRNKHGVKKEMILNMLNAYHD